MTSNAQIWEKKAMNERTARLFSPLFRKSKNLMTRYVLLHLGFLVLGGVEVALFFSLFALLGKSTILAFMLALFLLTLFSFFVIRLYMQAKKPEELMKLCDEYLMRCKETIGYQEGIVDHHLALAQASQKVATLLEDKEYSVYTPPSFFPYLVETLEKFSAFCHWRDFYLMREHLFTQAIEEHIKAVKCEPTRLQIHAALANAYVLLSSLFMDPYQDETAEEKWVAKERSSPEMERRFRETSEKAIEEFKILNYYAPNDPWVHLQLAFSYHDLQMPEEEIGAYETVMKLCPEDEETLFKLGMLYFQQGKNAQGLHVFEELKKKESRKADHLIKFYGHA